MFLCLSDLKQSEMSESKDKHSHFHSGASAYLKYSLGTVPHKITYSPRPKILNSNKFCYYSNIRMDNISINKHTVVCVLRMFLCQKKQGNIITFSLTASLGVPVGVAT